MNYETKLDLALRSFSEETLTYEEKFRALPPHERESVFRNQVNKVSEINKILMSSEGPHYYQRTYNQTMKDRKRSLKAIDKLKKTNQYDNFIAERNAIIKPIEDAYEEAKANKTLRPNPSFYVNGLGFVDIGYKRPFPDPLVYNMYIDKGYALSAADRYVNRDMSINSNPYEKFRYLPLEVQNKLFEEVIIPGNSRLADKYPGIYDKYADLDHRSKERFKSYAKDIHGINKRSNEIYANRASSGFTDVERDVAQYLVRKNWSDSIDEAYERAKKEGTLLK